MSFTGRIEDRLEIREFYGSFAYASSLAHTEDWMAHWVEDCRWNTQHFELEGKAQVRKQWGELWANFEKAALIHEICALRVEGDKASAICIAREIIRLKGGGIYKLAGCYEDELARSEGNWQFVRRVYRPLIEEIPVN